MKRLYILFFSLFIFLYSQAQPGKRSESGFTDVTLKLLFAAKNQQDPLPLINRLATINADSLIAELKDDQTKNAFWINTYNAYVQIWLARHPDWFNSPRLYKEKLVVAGHKISLGEIRDDILRRFKGTFWHRMFKGSFKKHMAVDSLDARMHFTLNNGKEGDPQISFYSPRRMERMFKIMTENYLQTHCKYYADTTLRARVEVPEFIGTYMADFGGQEQFYKLLESAGIIPVDARPPLVFTEKGTPGRQLLFFGE